MGQACHRTGRGQPRKSRSLSPPSSAASSPAPATPSTIAGPRAPIPRPWDAAWGWINAKRKTFYVLVYLLNANRSQSEAKQDPGETSRPELAPRGQRPKALDYSRPFPGHISRKLNQGCGHPVQCHHTRPRIFTPKEDYPSLFHSLPSFVGLLAVVLVALRSFPRGRGQRRVSSFPERAPTSPSLAMVLVGLCISCLNMLQLPTRQAWHRCTSFSVRARGGVSACWTPPAV